MDVVAQTFRDACPTGMAELSHLREALVQIAQEKISADAINAMLEDAAQGEKCIDIEYFLKWLSSDSIGALKDTSYLAGFCGSAPHVHHMEVPAEPRFPGSIEDFREKHKDDASALERLRNTVKVCGKCGKACAFTLACCNACGASLEEVEQSYSDNIFMGFIYGIAKGKFPYKISLRVQTPEFLCFDDPLQCSPCHLNAIPASLYCKDVRYLFTHPQRGLALVKQLEQIASEAALEQYWNHEAFRETIWAGQKRPTHWQALQGWAVMGFNFPPSMFQLHLQFIHLPLFPFHYNLLQRGEHLTHGRFFPLEYVKQALALGDAVRMEGSCDITSLIERVKTAGVDYDEIYRAMLETIHTQQRKLTPWREADFQYRVVQGKVFEGCTMRPEVDPKEVQKKDAHAMCNYGRPYKEEKPSGNYYQFAKEPHEIMAFEDLPD